MSKTISFRAYMIIFIACLTASMLFGILYRYDNKYNTNAQIFKTVRSSSLMLKKKTARNPKKSSGW
ncbi:MAG: hypothetical protein DBX40_08160 [Clostridiales bacterium]|nr:MAG: hypothetical protein DBX40_08160 [Clostridiales bacterium]